MSIIATASSYFAWMTYSSRIARKQTFDIDDGAHDIQDKEGGALVADRREMFKILFSWILLLLKEQGSAHQSTEEYYICTVDNEKIVVVDYLLAALFKIDAKMPLLFTFSLRDCPDDVVYSAKMLNEACPEVVGMSFGVDGSVVRVRKCLKIKNRNGTEYIINLGE